MLPIPPLLVSVQFKLDEFVNGDVVEAAFIPRYDHAGVGWVLGEEGGELLDGHYDRGLRGSIFYSVNDSTNVVVPLKDFVVLGSALSIGCSNALREESILYIVPGCAGFLDLGASVGGILSEGAVESNLDERKFPNRS